MRHRYTFDESQFLLDSIHQYTGTAIPHEMLSQNFEDKTLKQVLSSAHSRIEECRGASLSNKHNRDVSAAAFKFRDTNTRDEIEGLCLLQEQAYFGRIDFAVADNDVSEALYIGRCTLQDSKGNFFVYDWRNPIGQLFYQNHRGKAYYYTRSRAVQGEILLKRQYTIQGAVLRSFEDVGGSPLSVASPEADSAAIDAVSEDSILLGMLKRNSSGTMRQIVQSIQAEQDQVIRVSGDVVVVQGPAGSGKTVVALHRAAYLLYHMREEQNRLAQRFGRVSAQQMLIFSPNSIFSNYISRVLPDLNEDQIQQNILDDTLREAIKKWLPRTETRKRYKIEVREDHLDYVLSRRDDPLYSIRLKTSAFKSSPEMLALIEQFIKQLDRQVEAAFDDMEFSIYGQIITDADQRVFYRKSAMQDVYRLARGSNSVTNSIKYVLQNLVDRIADFDRTTRIPERIEEKRTVKNRDGSAKEIIEIRNPRLITVERLKEEYKRIENRLLPYVDYAITDLYKSLLQYADTPIDGHDRTPVEAAEYTQKSEMERKIAYEDIAPMLLLNGHYRGFESFGDISHAVIDEAQDYSLLHYEYIKNCLPENCTMTIVGDLNQAINPSLNLRDYDGLEAIFPARIKRMELNRSYRSSMEITDFASGILRNNVRIDNVRRTGTKPKIATTQKGKQASVITDVLHRLAGKEYNNIAILCRTRRDSEELFRQLEPGVKVKLLSDGSQITQGILVLPVQLAKGLEFDAVVLHDGGQAYYDREEERTLLYTACTRALHELYICYSGQASPLLPLASTDLYEPCSV